MIGISPAFVMACRKAGLEPGPATSTSPRCGRSASPAHRSRSTASSGSTTRSDRERAPHQRQRRHRRVHRHRPGQPADAGLRRRDRGALPRRRRGGVRRGRQGGRRRAGRARDPAADAVDAGRASGTTPTARATAPPTSTTTPAVWRHGDWIMFTERGSSVITGRSDATLNRGGVRLGTSEFYSVVEEIDEVLDSLVVHLEEPDELLLFVVLRPTASSSTTRIAHAHRRRRSATALSPRHAPDTIVAVPAIPRTLTGKKLELPGQADPHRHRRGRRRQPRRARRPGRDRAVRRLRPLTARAVGRGRGPGSLSPTVRSRGRPHGRPRRGAPSRGSGRTPSRRSSRSPRACSRA